MTVFKYRLKRYKSTFVNAVNRARIETDSFAPLFDESIKFSLDIGLRTRKHGGSVSLFLTLKSLGEKNRADVCFKFWIEDKGGNKFFESKALQHTFDARNDKSGFSNYQKRQTLQSHESNKFEMEDGFFICCDVRPGNEIESMTRPLISEVRIEKIEPTEPAVTSPMLRKRKADDTVNLPYGDAEMHGKRSFQSPRRSSLHRVAPLQQSSTPKVTSSAFNVTTLSDSTVRKLVWKMYLEGSHDAIINVDGTEFKVLKHVIASQSGFFSRVFTSDDSKIDSVNLMNLSVSKMGSLIKWFYLAELEDGISIKRLFRLFSLAYKYDIPKLKDECVEQILPNLTTENLCFFLIAAVKYRNERLRASLVRLIPRKPNEEYLRNFFENPDWIRVSQNNKDIANEIFKMIMANSQ